MFELQLLDLSSNALSGMIPVELFDIEGLDIALNLSCNALTGTIPPQISALNKLSILDLSHNDSCFIYAGRDRALCFIEFLVMRLEGM